MKKSIQNIIFILFAVSFFWSCKQEIKQPNVIFILTDDQGIGDLSCHGNPWIQTPNIDTFYEESVRLTDFHVSPVCTPSRSGFITGQYPINNGAWATFKGRASLRENSQSIAKIFKDNGYSTAMFGKWHLGSNYPSRPTDLGFDEVVQHEFGGIGEITDYWGNDYFDDVYLKNNVEKQYKGYCTDVWFNETISFIENNSEKPFFVYLPTNAAHHPLNVAEKYAAPYKQFENTEIPSANFYGMISNIDENFGRLMNYLIDKNLVDDTIVIFATDNGTQFGYSGDGKLGFNKGFKGRKGEVFEGAHRTPFFIRWKNGKIYGGKDVDMLTANVDLFPTLINLCNLKATDNLSFDGVNLSSYLKDSQTKPLNRTAFIHFNQDWRAPHKTNHSSIAKEQWRLINGEKLYNIKIDPLQENDLSQKKPEIVKSLQKENEVFYKKASAKNEFNEFAYAIVGSTKQKITKLTIQDAIGDDAPVWKQSQIAEGIKNENNSYALEFESDGVYKITCRRWPLEIDAPILGIPSNNSNHKFNYKAIQPEKVQLELFDKKYEQLITKNDTEITFNIELKAGKTMLKANFIEPNQVYGIYYIYIEKHT